MKYELIIFDADETLFDFKKSEKVALESTLCDFDIEYDEKKHLKAYKEINSAVWKELEQGFITQAELNVIRFQRFLKQLDLKQEALSFAEAYKKHLSNASYLYYESLELIRSLSGNYRLIILSNGLKEVQNNRLRKSAISRYFEAIIISEEVGLAKPDPRIFELAFSQIKHNSKDTALIVGDSLSSDIQGGINFGIDTCWFNAAKAENRTEIQPTYEISSLPDLKTVILARN